MDSNSVCLSQRIIPLGNIAVAERYMHTPQKSVIKSPQHQMKKPHQQQIFQDLTNLTQNKQLSNTNINVDHITLADSNENIWQYGNNNHEVIRRTKSSLCQNGKAKLARRVSFDPLALLLDASLEGELDLVKETTKQVRY